MSNELSSERRRLIMAPESTYGTDAVEALFTDGTTDIVYQEVADDVLDPERATVEFNRARGSQSGNKHRTVPVQTNVSGTWGLTGRRGTGPGNELPYWDPLARAMNLFGQVVSDTSVTYSPRTAQQQAATIYQFIRQLESDDYRLLYTTGVRGSGEFVFNLDEEAVLNFTGIGLYQGVMSDAAQFFSPTTGAAALLKDALTAVTARSGGGEELYADQNPILTRVMTLTVDGQVFEATGLSLNLNWTVTAKRVVNANGVSKVILTRPPTGARIGGGITLLDGDLALNKVLDLYEDGAEVALNLVGTSGDGGPGSDRITVDAPRMQVGRVSAPSDSGGIAQFDVPYSFNGDWSDLAADNDFSLTVDRV